MLHFTADKRFVAPTPMMAEVMTCVVLNGMPKCVAVSMTAEAVVSAAKP